MQVIERGRRVAEEPHEILFAERRAALPELFEALALDVLRDEEELAAFLEVIDGPRRFG